MCSWATRSSLKRSLARGASSTSIRDSELDLATAGSVTVFFFSFFPQTLLVSFVSSRSLILSARNSPYSRATSELVPVPLLSDSIQGLLGPAQESLGPFPGSLDPARGSHHPRQGWPCLAPSGPFTVPFLSC